MSRATTNKIIVLRKWLKGEIVKADFSKAHNAGQYPWSLEKRNGIECKRYEYPNPKGGRPIVGRELIFTDENVKRAEKILIRLGGKVPSRRDEVKKTSS